MRIDVEHPFPGARVLLNNTPIPYVHMADDIAGVVQYWVQTPGTGALTLQERKGWVTIVPPTRPACMPHPWIAMPQWNTQN